MTTEPIFRTKKGPPCVKCFSKRFTYTISKEPLFKRNKPAAFLAIDCVAIVAVTATVLKAHAMCERCGLVESWSIQIPMTSLSDAVNQHRRMRPVTERREKGKQ